MVYITIYKFFAECSEVMLTKGLKSFCFDVYFISFFGFVQKYK